MKRKLIRGFLALAIAITMVVCVVVYWRWTAHFPGLLVELLNHRIKLPPGFVIHTYASNVPNARSMALGSHGIVFVGSRRIGKIYALVDRNHRNAANEVVTIASGLNRPNGVAFRDGSLYVAEATRVIRYDDIESRLKNPPTPAVVIDNLPSGSTHEWKVMRFGPDGWVYIAIGAPCNICEPPDQREATIMRVQADGSRPEVFARGIRNSVGFDWHPQTKELWFTDNGRDWMGDDVPPDELNYAPRQGMHFGFPYCHGKDVPDPEFGRGHSCSEFEPPILELPAHVAALGMRFYNGKMFPANYHEQIFIAEHGSWNRKIPTGDRVSLVKFQGGKNPKYEVFAQGWLLGRLKLGRPVDVLVMPDGALLVSDDLAGAVYRISYQGP